jgi:hypothetical protein
MPSTPTVAWPTGASAGSRPSTTRQGSPTRPIPPRDSTRTATGPTARWSAACTSHRTGDDAAPGSPAHPLATITAALAASETAAAMGRPRPHIYVAGGHLPGNGDAAGRRRALWRLRPGFPGRRSDRLRHRGPAPPSGPPRRAGAALIARGVGFGPETVVRGVRFVGASATSPRGAAIGALVVDPRVPGYASRRRRSSRGTRSTGAMVQTDRRVRPPTAAVAPGEPPRAAIETDAPHVSSRGRQRRPRGRRGGVRLWRGRTSAAGRARTPPVRWTSAIPQADGAAGRGVGRRSRGAGAASTCAAPDFAKKAARTASAAGSRTSSSAVIGRSRATGRRGPRGRNGDAGDACADPLRTPDPRRAGRAAWPCPAPQAVRGSGGRRRRRRRRRTHRIRRWGPVPGPTASGAGAGGGGAGGCGGAGGRPGESGGPSIGPVRRGDAQRCDPPRNSTASGLSRAVGGTGGRGGAGGDGGHRRPRRSARRPRTGRPDDAPPGGCDGRR